MVSWFDRLSATSASIWFFRPSSLAIFTAEMAAFSLPVCSSVSL